LASKRCGKYQTHVEVRRVTEDETETVSFEVVSVERVHGRDDLIGMAVVELDVSGVAITLQGLLIRKVSAHRITVALPSFKSPRDGVMKTAIVLPLELTDAIGTAVANAFDTLGAPTLLTGDTRGATSLSTR